MKDLQVGDQVLTTSGKYRTVYSLVHLDHTTPTSFLQLYVDTAQAPLELTPDHMVYVVGVSVPRPAYKIKVGDMVPTVNGPSKIIKITTIVRKGAYNPLTTDGTIVAAGIFASNFPSPFRAEYLDIGGVPLLSMQFVIHLLFAPLRTICLGVSLDLCVEPHGRGGKIAYAHFLKGLGNFWKEQNLVLQLAIIFFLVSVCLLVAYPMSMALLVGGLWWMWKRRRRVPLGFVKNVKVD